MASDRDRVISYIIYILTVGSGLYIGETAAYISQIADTVQTKSSLPTRVIGADNGKKISNEVSQLSTTISKNIVCNYETCSYLNRRKRFSKRISSEEPPALANGEAVLSAFPTVDPIKVRKTNKNQRNKLGRGNKNYKYGGVRKNNAGILEDLDKTLTINTSSDKKGKKKMHSKKFQVPMREDQTQRRLRQHMQHKKKVKIFLRKRIQEQIKQRSQNRDGDF